MGIQTAPLQLRLRFDRSSEQQPVESSAVKLCMKQMQAAKSHPLPVEAQQLKLKILETHPIKTSRFSISHMKRLAIPPVEVPKGMCGSKVTRSTVGGKRVPFSRDMWENRKRKANKKRLDTVHETILY